jgi:hypothetical protein
MNIRSWRTHAFTVRILAGNIAGASGKANVCDVSGREDRFSVDL